MSFDASIHEALSPVLCRLSMRTWAKLYEIQHFTIYDETISELPGV